MRAERIGNRSEAALEYLARKPFENVALANLLLADTSPPSPASIYVALDDIDGLCGVAYFGGEVVLACGIEAVDAFAAIARDHRGATMILGPRATVAAYWSRVAAWHAAPRAIRERQLVMAIDRTALAPYEPGVLVRLARIDEWPAVADTIAQELDDDDPQRSSPEFAAKVRVAVERRLWWVGESSGRLCFFCNIGPWSPQTLQLQGIATPAEMRGKGLATSALGALCDRLLDFSPALSLYVNDFNAPAIALYERLGFKIVSESQTLLF